MPALATVIIIVLGTVLFIRLVTRVFSHVIGFSAVCTTVLGILLNPILMRDPVDCRADITQQPESFPTAANRFGSKPERLQSVTNCLRGNPQDFAPSSEQGVGDLGELGCPHSRSTRLMTARKQGFQDDGFQACLALRLKLLVLLLQERN